MQTDEHRLLRDSLREFAANRLTPFAADWDRNATFPKQALSELAALGAFGIAVPEKYGGAGMDATATAIALEEIAFGDGATSTIISVNNSPVCAILLAWANEAQKQKYLVPLAQGQMLGAFCLTEPHVGSDASGLRTSAVLEGDHWVLNGVKQFITSGKTADVAIVMAVTDKAAGKRGISAFIVETKTPGYVVARLEEKMGQHASDTAQILFENCRVPSENLIGEEGAGYKIALAGLEGGRIGIASQALGMARAAYEAAEICKGARGIRQADLRASGIAIPAGGHGNATRSRAATDSSRGRVEGRRRAVLETSGDGEAVRFGNGGNRVLECDSDSRRLWLRRRLSGRAHLSRRACVPDLRGHQRHSANPDRAAPVKR